MKNSDSIYEERDGARKAPAQMRYLDQTHIDDADVTPKSGYSAPPGPNDSRYHDNFEIPQLNRKSIISSQSSLNDGQSRLGSGRRARREDRRAARESMQQAINSVFADMIDQQIAEIACKMVIKCAKKAKERNFVPRGRQRQRIIVDDFSDQRTDDLQDLTSQQNNEEVLTISNRHGVHEQVDEERLDKDIRPIDNAPSIKVLDETKSTDVNPQSDVRASHISSLTTSNAKPKVDINKSAAVKSDADLNSKNNAINQLPRAIRSNYVINKKKTSDNNSLKIKSISPLRKKGNNAKNNDSPINQRREIQRQRFKEMTASALTPTRHVKNFSMHGKAQDVSAGKTQLIQKKNTNAFRVPVYNENDRHDTQTDQYDNLHSSILGRRSQLSGNDAFSDGPTPIRGVKRARYKLNQTQVGSGFTQHRQASVTSQEQMKSVDRLSQNKDIKRKKLAGAPVSKQISYQQLTTLKGARMALSKSGMVDQYEDLNSSRSMNIANKVHDMPQHSRIDSLTMKAHKKKQTNVKSDVSPLKGLNQQNKKIQSNEPSKEPTQAIGKHRYNLSQSITTNQQIVNIKLQSGDTEQPLKTQPSVSSFTQSKDQKTLEESNNLNAYSTIKVDSRYKASLSQSQHLQFKTPQKGKNVNAKNTISSSIGKSPKNSSQYKYTSHTTAKNQTSTTTELLKRSTALISESAIKKTDLLKSRTQAINKHKSGKVVNRRESVSGMQLRLDTQVTDEQSQVKEKPKGNLKEQLTAAEKAAEKKKWTKAMNQSYNDMLKNVIGTTDGPEGISGIGVDSLLFMIIKESVDVIQKERKEEKERKERSIENQAVKQVYKKILRSVTQRCVTEIIQESTDAIYRFEDDAISLADSVLRSFLASELKSILSKTIAEEKQRQSKLEEMDFISDVDYDGSMRAFDESDFDHHNLPDRSARMHKNSNISRYMNKSSSGSEHMTPNSPGKHLFDQMMHEFPLADGKVLNRQNSRQNNLAVVPKTLQEKSRLKQNRESKGKPPLKCQTMLSASEAQGYDGLDESSRADASSILRESSRGLDKMRKSVIQQSSERYLMKKKKLPKVSGRATQHDQNNGSNQKGLIQSEVRDLGSPPDSATLIHYSQRSQHAATLNHSMVKEIENINQVTAFESQALNRRVSQEVTVGNKKRDKSKQNDWLDLVPEDQKESKTKYELPKSSISNKPVVPEEVTMVKGKFNSQIQEPKYQQKLKNDVRQIQNPNQSLQFIRKKGMYASSVYDEQGQEPSLEGISVKDNDSQRNTQVGNHEQQILGGLSQRSSNQSSIRIYPLDSIKKCKLKKSLANSAQKMKDPNMPGKGFMQFGKQMISPQKSPKRTAVFNQFEDEIVDFKEPQAAHRELTSNEIIDMASQEYRYQLSQRNVNEETPLSFVTEAGQSYHTKNIEQIQHSTLQELPQSRLGAYGGRAELQSKNWDTKPGNQTLQTKSPRKWATGSGGQMIRKKNVTDFKQNLNNQQSTDQLEKAHLEAFADTKEFDSRALLSRAVSDDSKSLQTINTVNPSLRTHHYNKEQNVSRNIAKTSAITVANNDNSYYDVGGGPKEMKTLSRAKKIQASTKALQPKRLHKDPNVKQYVPQKRVDIDDGSQTPLMFSGQLKSLQRDQNASSSNILQTASRNFEQSEINSYQTSSLRPGKKLIPRQFQENPAVTKSGVNPLPVRTIYDLTGMQESNLDNSVHSSVIRGNTSSGGAIGRSFNHTNQSMNVPRFVGRNQQNQKNADSQSVTGLTDDEELKVNDEIFGSQQYQPSDQNNFISYKSDKSLERMQPISVMSASKHLTNKHKSRPKSGHHHKQSLGSDGFDQSPINSDQEFSINPYAYDELQLQQQNASQGFSYQGYQSKANPGK